MPSIPIQEGPKSMYFFPLTIARRGLKLTPHLWLQEEAKPTLHLELREGPSSRLFLSSWRGLIPRPLSSLRVGQAQPFSPAPGGAKTRPFLQLLEGAKRPPSLKRRRPSPTFLSSSIRGHSPRLVSRFRRGPSPRLPSHFSSGPRRHLPSRVSSETSPHLVPSCRRELSPCLLNRSKGGTNPWLLYQSNKGPTPCHPYSPGRGKRLRPPSNTRSVAIAYLPSWSSRGRFHAISSTAKGAKTAPPLQLLKEANPRLPLYIQEAPKPMALFRSYKGPNPHSSLASNGVQSLNLFPSSWRRPIPLFLSRS